MGFGISSLVLPTGPARDLAATFSEMALASGSVFGSLLSVVVRVLLQTSEDRRGLLVRLGVLVGFDLASPMP